ncbi:MAG: tetrahydrofolate dehydrogenase/cyclohydrolase catalytic domain-containing protein, partial [Sphingomicrobium sp.]
MSARIIDGKAAAAILRAQVAAEVARFRVATGRAPGLAVVLVGEDPASAVYVRNKGRATIEAGMESFEHRLPTETGEQELFDLVERLNTDPAVDGILVQLPLPDHIDPNKVL